MSVSGFELPEKGKSQEEGEKSPGSSFLGNRAVGYNVVTGVASSGNALTNVSPHAQVSAHAINSVFPKFFDPTGFEENVLKGAGNHEVGEEVANCQSNVVDFVGPSFGKDGGGPQSIGFHFN
ncbi:hypothetical protein Hanom_Chr06g00493361 [Helianthus anomalus]